MKTLLIFLVVLMSTWRVYSQNNTSARITVFKPGDNSNGPKQLSHKDSLAGHDHNCIKWNCSLLVRGVFLVNWEFRATGNLTVELGLGLTYRDFIFEATHSDMADNNGNTIGFGDNVGEPGINVCGEGGVRYYLSGFDNFEGIYIAGTISYRPYSFPNSSDIALYGGSQVPGYDFLDGQFKIGYQTTGYYSDFTYDIYAGIGYRSATVKYYGTLTNSNTGQTIGVPQTLTEAFPQLLFGVKIGFAF